MRHHRRPGTKPFLGGACAAGAIGLAMLLASAPANSARSGTLAIPVAIADFDYADTSGEPRDRTAEHKALLDSFTRAIRVDLAKSGKYRIVDLDCRRADCSPGRSDPDELVADARRAGARLLLFGGIHKVSTLIQQARVEGVDVETDKLIYDRALSFRGDDDDSWRHAEAFLVKDLEGQELVK